jgi:hypothetical protein
MSWRTISQGLFISLLPILLFASTGVAQAPLHGPEDPPPLGVNQSFTNGSPNDGDIGRPVGETGHFWNVGLATLTDVWWSPLADEVKLSLDGAGYSASEIMHFLPSLSDLPNGIVTWRGSTILCGTSSTVYTRCVMTVRDIDMVTPIPLVDPASLGLPASIGGMIPVPGMNSFLVHLQMFASWSSDTGFEPYLDFYDYWIDYYHITGCTNQAYSSFEWGYYWEGVAPWLTANNPLVLDEGATGTITPDLLAADDIESPPTEITYTVGPGGTGPPVHGTLFLANVPLGQDDTFTQDDLDNNRVTYEHNGSETTSDGFPFNCMDGDSLLASDGPYTVFQFQITINPVNDPPVALPDTFQVNTGHSFIDTLSAEDPDSPLLYFLTESGELGTAVLLDINTGAFEYTADPDTVGVDTVRFQVNDGEYLSNEATVLIHIVNDPPEALDDTGVTWENVALQDTLSGQDADSGTLSFAIATNGSKGTAVLTDPGAGAFTYTPNAAAIGIDTFTFVVNDGFSTSDPGTFTVIIRPNLDIGDVVVADGGARAVVLIDPVTDQWATVSHDTSSGNLRGIGLLMTNELLVVDPDRGVVLIDPVTGNQTVHCGLENFTTGPVGPWDLAVEDTDSYLVTDPMLGVLRVNAQTGEASVFSTGAPMFFAMGICATSTRDIYVADAGAYIGETSQVVHIDPVTGDRTVISAGGNLQIPLFISMDAEGRLLVSDAGSLTGGTDQVVRIDVSSGAQEVLTSGNLLNFTTGIDVTESGEILVASANDSVIVDVDPVTGDQQVFSPGTPLVMPFGLMVVYDITTAVEISDPLPTAFALLPATPNPFNPRTDLRFDLPEPACVTLKVFDATGRLVRTLADSEQRTAGRHVLTWDGRNDGGRALASGVYLYRLEAGKLSATGKMVLLK